MKPIEDSSADMFVTEKSVPGIVIILQYKHDRKYTLYG